MEIEFLNIELKSLCQTEKIAKKKLGVDCAKKLRARVADLMAAKYVGDLYAGKPHPLIKKRLGQYAVYLSGAKRLVFEPAMVEVPKNLEGSIKWSAVNRVRIVFIGDYHVREFK